MNRPTKLDALTSLRFFAAGMIVLGHTHPIFGSMNLATEFSLSQGVSFFFVLSGFILAYNYPEFATIDDFLFFLKARIARIWPTHIAAIIFLFLVTAALPLGGLNGSAAAFVGLANFFLFQSIVPLRDVFLTFNGVAWSISTEMFFYLAFPFLIVNAVIGWRVKLALLTGVTGAFLWFAAAWTISADESLPTVTLMGLLYVNPFVRLLEFFAGILACSVYRRIPSVPAFHAGYFSVAEFAIVALALWSMHLSPRVISMTVLDGNFANVISYYLTKSGSFWVFALLIIVFALGRGVLSRLLSLSPMVLLGEISFSLYLVHMTVLQWYEQNKALFQSVPEWGKSAGYWALSLLVAYTLHKTIELPCRKLIVSAPKITFRQFLGTLFARKQIAHLGLAVIVLCLMINAPAFLKKTAVQDLHREGLLEKHRLTPPVIFSDYLTLQSARIHADSAKTEMNLDLLLRINKQIPGRYKLAIHIVDTDGAILWKTDILLSEARNLLKNAQWVEYVKLPAAVLKEDVRLGLAVYADPQDLLPVTYSRTDYDGHRALIDIKAVSGR